MAKLRHRATFCGDRPNRCGIWRFFDFAKMAAVRHLGFMMRMFRSHTKGICLESLQWFR